MGNSDCVSSQCGVDGFCGGNDALCTSSDECINGICVEGGSGVQDCISDPNVIFLNSKAKLCKKAEKCETIVLDNECSISVRQNSDVVLIIPQDDNCDNYSNDDIIDLLGWNVTQESGGVYTVPE